MQGVAERLVVMGGLEPDVTTAHYTQISVERLRPWVKKYEQYLLKVTGNTRSAKVLRLGK